jgi:hypothetical protein
MVPSYIVAIVRGKNSYNMEFGPDFTSAGILFRSLRLIMKLGKLSG